MNRLHHLKLTLPQNLRDNEEYENLEFVLLDYNSSDGMEEWVKSELKEYIQKGRLIYLKTTEPVFFHRSHSRNIAFKAASGEIICNVDADNYTGKGFASYINQEFNKHSNIFLIPPRDASLNDIVGRVCVKKEDFLKVEGYDEEMSDYGAEDKDFYGRLILLGLKENMIKGKVFFNVITHAIEERYENEKIFRNILSIYINYIHSERSEMLILNKDNTFKQGNLISFDEEEGPSPEPVLEEKVWITGKWEEKNNELYCIDLTGKKEIYQLDLDSPQKMLKTTGKVFYSIPEANNFNNLVYKISIITNNQKLRNNFNAKRTAVNNNIFGKATIFKNFSSIPYTI